jgi:hypothetical protein
MIADSASPRESRRIEFSGTTTANELMEAVWVAAEMRAGGAYAHSTLMLTTPAGREEKEPSMDDPTL